MRWLSDLYSAALQWVHDRSSSLMVSWCIIIVQWAEDMSDWLWIWADEYSHRWCAFILTVTTSRMETSALRSVKKIKKPNEDAWMFFSYCNCYSLFSLSYSLNNICYVACYAYHFKVIYGTVRVEVKNERNAEFLNRFLEPRYLLNCISGSVSANVH